MHGRIACAAVALTLAAGVPTATAAPAELLPDLVEQPPTDLQIDGGSGAWHLGFTSAIENHGDGELRVEGSRPDTSSPLMSADQVIRRSDGSSVRYPGIGVMKFYVP